MRPSPHAGSAPPRRRSGRCRPRMARCSTSAPRNPQRAFDENTADVVNFALQSVVNNGTGGPARALGRPVAAKTGSTDEYRSAWFAGYVPQLASAVSFSKNDKNGNVLSLSGVGGQVQFFGSGFPARVWTAFMIGALAEHPGRGVRGPGGSALGRRWVQPRPRRRPRRPPRRRPRPRRPPRRRRPEPPTPTPTPTPSRRRPRSPRRPSHRSRPTPRSRTRAAAGARARRRVPRHRVGHAEPHGIAEPWPYPDAREPHRATSVRGSHAG